MDEKITKNMSKIAILKDNFIKMALISLRIRAKVPIILMGQTGIGKTALVKLLTSIMDLKFYTLNIHAGITENEIIMFV